MLYCSTLDISSNFILAMKKTQNKLELTWIGKEDEPLAIEPRLLLDAPEYSFGEVEAGTLTNGKSWPGNMLIHGDNLLALRALEQDFAGQIKCIYIDPPYNTGNAFEHYDDGVEHSIWLNLMYYRLISLHKLLSNDGVLCMHLDDGEVHYAKVICDEIFGRDNFISTIACKSSTPSGLKTAHKDKTIIKTKDFILVYRKSENLKIRPQYIKKDIWDVHFSKFLDIDNLQVLNLIDVLIENGIFPEGSKNSDITITPKFRKFFIKHKDNIFQTQPVMPEEHKMASLQNRDKVYRYFGDDGSVNYAMNGRRFSFLSSSMNIIENGTEDLATLLCDFWGDIDFQNTQNEGAVSFPASKKPEKLIKRILSLFTDEGDLVLDSFLGSGTTSAVAHKMNRRWIGVEMGNHAYTHCVVRLQNVVSGKDQTGISKEIDWQGGGGFKFYELAPSLLNKDKYGNLVINKEYNADMLAAAMAKHQGFTYSPDSEVYWKQGRSSEHDFIFTTTQLITAEMLDAIHDQLGENESLLICCTKFQPECRNKFPDITIKKIPKVLLDICEFDHDDYSLNIVSVPAIKDEEWEELETGGE